MSSSSLFSSSHHKFSLTDIIELTDNFEDSRIYQDNEYWTEYVINITPYDDNGDEEKTRKGIVKHFKENTYAEFMNEVRKARMNEVQPNPNLIPLVGYCTEAGKKILVYEYNSTGAVKTTKYMEVADAQPSHELDLVNAPFPRRFGYKEAILALSTSSYRRFSLDEIRKATSCFNSKITRTEGGFNEYVTNISSNHFELKVKHFHEKTDSFEKEVAVMVFVPAHPNIISLEGYCIEWNQRILVYKSPANSCFQYISENLEFPWKVRLNICLGFAYGLQHLHKPTSMFPFGIVLGVMSLENILFNGKWTPKLCNFGGSKFGIDKDFSKADDVQTFGSLLIAFLSRRSMEHMRRSYAERDSDFEDWVIRNADTSGESEVLALKLFVDLIGKCCLAEESLRPTMDEVVLDLEAVLKCQGDTYGELNEEDDLIRESRMMVGVTEELDSQDDINLKKITSTEESNSLLDDPTLKTITSREKSDLLDDPNLNKITEESDSLEDPNLNKMTSTEAEDPDSLDDLYSERSLLDDLNLKNIAEESDSLNDPNLNKITSTEESYTPDDTNFNKIASSDVPDSLDDLNSEESSLNDLNLNKITSTSSSSSFASSFPSTSFSSSSFSLLSRLYRRFSLDDIKEVTNNLDQEKVQTKGQDWNEYLVQMNLDGKTERTWATVKHFKDCSDVFEQEINMVTKIQAHSNLISLLGYCIESGESFLIYNYTEFGSLLDYVKEGSQIHLSWKERLNICLGAAYGLQHIHKATDEFRNGLIHGDINPANILLDKDWAAKISNIGGCHTVQLSSTFSRNIVKDQWTRYAPEYVKSNRLTKKVDVYAFGIILFQVLCRRRIPEEWDESNLEYVEESYASWANRNVDIAIKDAISGDSLKEFTDCIGRCLESNPYKRCMMDHVVRDLETALSFQECDDGQINLSASSRTKSRVMDGVAMSVSSVSVSTCSCRQFSLDEIRKATNKFDMKKCLGKGGEGTVYLAELCLDSTSQKSQVAVKHINKGLIGEFEKEIATVSNIQHPNIVSLLGYCNESEEKILIYEYMGKGSLSDYVKMKSPSLSWKQRLKICLGAAYGLQHLHKPSKEFPKGIIHRDMKPENILIDNNWVAKVSDFGMLKLSTMDQAKSTIITFQAKGTAGYFAPETLLFSESQLSRKIDVYSFGCVMFEVLCRKKRWEAVDKSVYFDQNENVGLLAYENVDLNIIDQISEESKLVFIDTIAASFRVDPKRRPTMDEVVQNLESALNFQEQSEEQKEIMAAS